MATTYAAAYTTQNSSGRRAVAMALALASAVVLSPLYTTRTNDTHYYDHTRWGSGFVLPMVLAGLIIAIKTTSGSSSPSSSCFSYSSLSSNQRATVLPHSDDPSWVLRIGGSSWGLAGVLGMLMLVLSWQDSVQHFFWR